MKTTLLTSALLLTSTACADVHSALSFRHRESQGVGYHQGYSTADYYLTSHHNNLEFLLNLRGHVFNDGKGAGNGGFAFRHSLNDDSSRIGANLFYDVRDVGRFVAQQVSGGLEWISNTVDVRLNGYLPVGKLRYFKRHTFEGFSGNQLLIKKKFSAALPCVEGEVGTSLARPLYFAAGAYYLFRESDHAMHVGQAWGWKARFDVDLGDYWSVGASVTHDSIFKTRVQGYLSLHIPLGPWKSMKNSSKDLERRRIIRNEIIPIQSRKKSGHSLDPDDYGATMRRFLFVNNQALGSGDGTFEHPFISLKEAEKNSQPGDVIYVFRGDGTPHFMNEGIVLKDDQLLASSGAKLSINDLEIPAQTPGQNPTITNIHADQPVITNPGKTKLANFFFMSPSEYFQLYDTPSPMFDPPSSETPTPPDVPPSPYNDPALDDWVVLEAPANSTPSDLESSWVDLGTREPTPTVTTSGPFTITDSYTGENRK